MKKNFYSKNSNEFLFEQKMIWTEQVLLFDILVEDTNWMKIKNTINDLSKNEKINQAKRFFTKIKSEANNGLKNKYTKALIIILASMHLISADFSKLDIISKKIESASNIKTVVDYINANETSERHERIDKNAIQHLNDISINDFSISDQGINLIKSHEKLRLNAYKLNDGKITIGYGHAEPESSSQYQMGDSISIEEAEDLFKYDLDIAERGVKRILSKWQSDGVNFRITPSMYDAMVSMAFNKGVTGLVTSEFMQQLKKTKNPKKVAHLIKTSRIGSWEGLKKRRNDEYTLFIQDFKQR